MKTPQHNPVSMIKCDSEKTKKAETTMIKTLFKKIPSGVFQALAVIGVGVVANILGADAAHAQDIGNTITRLGNSVSKASNLVYMGAYAGGTTALMMGAFKLKAHAENPSQTPMQQGLARVGVGAALVALPSVGSTIQNSLGLDQSGLQSQQNKINVGIP